MTLSCAFDVALVQKLALCTAVSKNTALPVLMGMLGAVVKRIQNLKTVRSSNPTLDCWHSHGVSPGFISSLGRKTSSDGRVDFKRVF
jgi:hypothetical protein